MLHGGNIYGFSPEEKAQLIDFSANISPLGIPEKVQSAMIGELQNALHYPDPDSDRLRAAIAEKMNIDKYQVICGNGAADIIYRFVYALRPKRALVIHPTFVEYEEAMDCVGTEIISYDLCREDFQIREDILDQMQENLDVLFICNPNNPTGVLTPRNLLIKILDKALNCHMRVVVDECFLDFSPEEDAYTLKGVLGQYPNLLILKSFTKLYAIPGVRAGYGLSSDRALLKAMRHSGQSWPVSTLAVSAAVAALAEDDYKAQVITYVEQERAYLEAVLSALKIAYVPGHANYMLIHLPEETQLYEKLLARHIMIRTCTSYDNLDGTYYRIAINSHEANVCLIEALSQVLEQSQCE